MRWDTRSFVAWWDLRVNVLDFGLGNQFGQHSINPTNPDLDGLSNDGVFREASAGTETLYP